MRTASKQFLVSVSVAKRSDDDPTNKRRKNDDNSLCYVIKILSNTRTIFSQGRMFSYFLRFTQKARFFESRNLADGFRVDGFPFDGRLQHITVYFWTLRRKIALITCRELFAYEFNGNRKRDDNCKNKKRK